jgi:hypothetical protein
LYRLLRGLRASIGINCVAITIATLYKSDLPDALLRLSVIKSDGS